MNKLYTIIAISTLILISCDYENPVDYNVDNKSDKKIKVIFSQWKYDDGMYLANDTIVNVEPNEKKTLFIRVIVGSSVWNPENGNDTIWAINRLKIFNNDTVMINKNFRLLNYWKYKNISRHHSELNLTINNDNENKITNR